MRVKPRMAFRLIRAAEAAQAVATRALLLGASCAGVSATPGYLSAAAAAKTHWNCVYCRAGARSRSGRVRSSAVGRRSRSIEREGIRGARDFRGKRAAEVIRRHCAG
jgi:hypothetical protein